MDIQKQAEELREKIIKLGKVVAAQKTTTTFPEWCLFKIGFNTLQNNEFDHEYYESLLGDTVKIAESD